MTAVGTVARDSQSSDDICSQRLAALGFIPASTDTVKQKSEPEKDRKEWKRQLMSHIRSMDDKSVALESGA